MRAAKVDEGKEAPRACQHVRRLGVTTSGTLKFLSARAIGAVVARFVHTEEVTGSNPVSRTETIREDRLRRM